MQGKPRKKEFPLYLITGLVIGIAIGLFYAWRLSPVEVIDTVPASMSDEHKDAYRLLVAQAFMTNGDPQRAIARLFLLGDDDIVNAVEDQAQRLLSRGNNIDDTRAMATLLEALEKESAIGLPTATVGDEYTVLDDGSDVTPTMMITPTVVDVIVTEANTQVVTTEIPTATMMPTMTATPTALPAYALESFEKVCDPTIDTPLIQVMVKKNNGEQVPGVPIMVIWDDGDNVFYTGLKPNLGLGYADFEMTPGVSYDLHLVEGGEGVMDLSPQSCTKNDGSTYWSGWLVVFQKK
jgi:hypothetical protein